MIQLVAYTPTYTHSLPPSSPTPQDCVALPHLLVVPLSVLPNWERELTTWAPYLRVVSLKGNAAARQLLLEHCWYAPHGGGKQKGSFQVRNEDKGG